MSRHLFLSLSPFPSRSSFSSHHSRHLSLTSVHSRHSISRYRTGTFRPTVTIFEPFDKNLSSVVFGTNLTRWAEGKEWKLPKEGMDMPANKLELVPSVLKALLEALEAGYKGVEDVGGEFGLRKTKQTLDF